MKAILAEYSGDIDTVKVKKDSEEENWITVCNRFNDDVNRVCDVKDLENFTALYQCFDDDNISVFYLVEEDKRLYKLRRKHFLDNIGKGITDV